MKTKTVRLIIHLFRGTSPDPEVQVWEKGYACDEPNPLLLRVEKWWEIGGDVRLHLFSLERIEDGVAIYHPYATHEKMNLIRDLPNWGYARVEGETTR